jgi:hypothetical protein
MRPRRSTCACALILAAISCARASFSCVVLSCCSAASRRRSASAYARACASTRKRSLAAALGSTGGAAGGRAGASSPAVLTGGAALGAMRSAVGDAGGAALAGVRSAGGAAGGGALAGARSAGGAAGGGGFRASGAVKSRSISSSELRASLLARAGDSGTVLPRPTGPRVDIRASSGLGLDRRVGAVENRFHRERSNPSHIRLRVHGFGDEMALS